jgi:hypothetical protein
MPISKKISGNLLLSNTYQRIYPHVDDDTLRDDKWTEGWIYLHEMTAGDEVQILFTSYDEVAQQHRGYDEPIIQGIQEPIPAFHIGALVDNWFRVQIKQITAPSSYKSINYKFYEIRD